MPSPPSAPAPRPKLVLFGRSTDRETTTITDILRQETVGGVLMLVATVAALIWANVAFESYEHFREFELGPMNLEHWAADGVLTIFFFVAGLELKRELTVGSLSKPSEALVPLVAAVCGMVVPAAIFLAINLPGEGGHPRGWAIPMATDIAFALAILAVVGSRLPASLRAFLLTLAIVDDLGAILVIATVFTDGLSLAWLGGAALIAALWGLLQWRHIDFWWLYLPLGLLCWYCTWQGGIHPTIAGVAIGLLTRTSDTDPNAPVDRWEHRWRPISAGFAVPVFALLAAGVQVSWPTLVALFQQPLTLGIILGLIVGKVLGIWGASYLTARFTKAELAPDLRWSEIGSVSVLAGVGFTVALLISELAFAGDPELRDSAKGAVLIGSILAAVLAAVLLRRRSVERKQGLPGVEPASH